MRFTKFAEFTTCTKFTKAMLVHVINRIIYFSSESCTISLQELRNNGTDHDTDTGIPSSVLSDNRSADLCLYDSRCTF